MKRCIFLFLFLILVNNIINGQFKAVRIPDDMLAKMKIVGDTADWNWVSKKYLITEQSMYKVVSADNNNWNCWIKVGWSDLNHKLYIIAKVTDNIFITNNSEYYFNDCMQFAINPDNGGGLFGSENNRAKHTIKGYFVYVSDKSTDLIVDVGPDWLKGHEKEYISWNVQHYDKKEGGGYERIYEMCLNLWDIWENRGAEYSSPTELYPLKRIRLALIFNDSDILQSTSFNEWTNLAGNTWWRDASVIPEFVLDIPFKNGISWQAIRYVLGQ